MMVDVHAHLAAKDFYTDLEDVLERAVSAQVAAVVVVPECLAEFNRVMELTAKFSDVLVPCLGLHPVQQDSSEEGDTERSVRVEEVLPVLDFIRREHLKLVGIGEVGLDFTPRFVKKEDDKAAQRHVLTEQAKLAMSLDLPLNVHSRSAGRPTLQLLKSLGVEKALMHAFDGRASVAMSGVHMGYYFSIPPSIVHSEQKQALVKQLPLDHLILETDSPALGPVKQTRNEPANLEISCREVARIKGLSMEEVWEITTRNAHRLFPKLARLVKEANIEGAGDVVLAQLTHLVTETGLIIPTSYKVAEPEMSLHEVSDPCQDELLAIWEQLRAKLKAFCSVKLQALPNCSLDGSAQDKVVKIERCRIVQGLSLLYPPLGVLQWYGQLRKRQLESNSWMPSAGHLGKQFIDWISVAERMISEDLVLLQGCFFMEVTKLKPSDFLKEYYLCIVLDKVRTVLSVITAPPEFGEKLSFLMTDIVAISEIMLACKRFDGFLLTAVTFTRSPSAEPVLYRRLSAVLKSSKRPLDVVSSIQDLKQLPPLRGLAGSASGNMLKPIQETLSEERKISKSHCADAVWDWLVLFEPCICLVTESIEAEMMSAVQGYIAEEKTSFGNSNRLPDVSLADSVYSSLHELPKRITKCCHSVVEVIEIVEFVVTAGKSSVFSSALSTFTRVLGKTLTPYMEHVRQMTDGFPEHMPVHCFYLLLSSVVYLSTALHDCHLLVNSYSSAPRVAAVSEKVDDLRQHLEQQLLNYHCNVCAMVVLQDAESNFYADSKPFYEDERSSFSIQMWNYYLQGLKHDMWTTLPSYLAKKLLGRVMEECLSLLSARYSSTEVSEARKTQYRADIVAILSITSTFLWGVCESTDVLLYQPSLQHCKGTTSSSIASIIWNHCNKLVTSCTAHQSVASDAQRTNNRDWLEIIEPELFGQTRDAADLVHVLVTAKWLLDQPLMDHHVLAELLMMNECALPQIIFQNHELFCSKDLATALWDIMLCSGSSKDLLRSISILNHDKACASNEEISTLFEDWVMSKLTQLVVERAISMPLFVLCHEIAQSAMASRLFSSLGSAVPEQFQLQTEQLVDLPIAVSNCLVQAFEELEANILTLPSSLLYCLMAALDDKSLFSIDNIFLCCCRDAIQKLSMTPIITSTPAYKAVIAEVERQLQGALKRTSSTLDTGDKMAVSLKGVVDQIRLFHDSGSVESCDQDIKDTLLVKGCHKGVEIWSSMLKTRSMQVMKLLEAVAGKSSLPHLGSNGSKGGVVGVSAVSEGCLEQFHPLQSFDQIASQPYNHAALQKADSFWQ